VSPRAFAALLAVSLAGAARAAGDAPIERVELVATSIDGCPGIPFPRASRQLAIDGDEAVDSRARFWELDRPAAYAHGRAERRYRIGQGVLVVAAELSSGLDRETVRISIAEPIAPEYLATYLPGVSLPCQRTTLYSARRRGPGRADLAALARFDAALLEATERLYDADFAAGEARLREAMALRPADHPHWMMARLRYLRSRAGRPGSRAPSASPATRPRSSGPTAPSRAHPDAPRATCGRRSPTAGSPPAPAR
jgi:hypothetical protein